MVVRRRIRRVHWIAYGLLERVGAPVTRIRLPIVAAVVESHGEVCVGFRGKISRLQYLTFHAVLRARVLGRLFEGLGKADLASSK